MRRKARSAAMALAVSALIAGLLAPSAVASKKTTYNGPLLGPPAQEPGYSLVAFKVVSRGKGRKLHPVTVLKFNAFYLNVSCTDSQGNRAQPERVAFSTFEEPIPVKKREFTFTTIVNRGPYGHSGSQTIELRGRIPRKGPVTGTIRYSGSWVIPASPPDIPATTVTCDSTTAWKATPGEFVGLE